MEIMLHTVPLYSFELVSIEHFWEGIAVSDHVDTQYGGKTETGGNYLITNHPQEQET